MWYGAGRLMLTRSRLGGSKVEHAEVADSTGGDKTDFAHFALLPDGRVVAVWNNGGGVFTAVEAP
jgi:hypothetical protein